MSEENKTIAKTARGVFGGTPKVWSYADENDRSTIDILSCADRPVNNVTSYATLGLSDFPSGFQVDGEPLGVEILGISASSFELFPNLLATCAFNIMNSHHPCYPGAVYQDVVAMYLPESGLKHILFCSPFGWGDAFSSLKLDTKTVAWLQALPISDSERQYAQDHGAEALERLFEEKQIDYYDLNRATAV